jgi:plasmid stabilization system protein ParE
MDGYIAFYTVEADRIVIVRVVDSRMDIEREILK